MSVKTEFNQTVSAVEQVLAQGLSDPRIIRESIKKLVLSYQAKDVVSKAYKSFADSGVLQWKTFLRAANVKQDEPIEQYVQRIHSNLDQMKRFDSVHLKP